MILAIVPAAGRGARFGSTSATPTKLLASVDGEPMLDRTLGSLIEGGVERVVVVVGPGGALEKLTRLGDPRVRVVTNPDPAPGMLSSIQAGWASAEGDPVLVLPGDMPFVRAQTVRVVIETCRSTGAIVSPRTGGKRGHPVGLPGALRAAVLAAPPASTLKDVIDAGTLRRVAVDVDDPGVVRDVDVPADLG